MQIIGLAGRARVGKTTSAEYLVKHYKFQEFYFSQYVKQVAEMAGWDGLKDERGRKYLQQMGDCMRNYDKDIMIKEIYSKIKTYEYFCNDTGIEPRIVISDLRLVEEIEAVKSWGGQVYLIQRNVNEIVPNHKTEQLNETSFEFDTVLGNNGSFGQLYNALDSLVEIKK